MVKFLQKILKIFVTFDLIFRIKFCNIFAI